MEDVTDGSQACLVEVIGRVECLDANLIRYGHKSILAHNFVRLHRLRFRLYPIDARFAIADR